MNAKVKKAVETIGDRMLDSYGWDYHAFLYDHIEEYIGEHPEMSKHYDTLEKEIPKYLDPILEEIERCDNPMR